MALSNKFKDFSGWRLRSAGEYTAVFNLSTPKQYQMTNPNFMRAWKADGTEVPIGEKTRTETSHNEFLSKAHLDEIVKNPDKFPQYSIRDIGLMIDAQKAYPGAKGPSGRG